MKMSSVLGFRKLVWLSLAVLLCSFPAWSQQPLMDPISQSVLADPQAAVASAGGQQIAGQRAGSINGSEAYV